MILGVEAVDSSGRRVGRSNRARRMRSYDIAYNIQDIVKVHNLSRDGDLDLNTGLKADARLYMPMSCPYKCS